MQTHHNPLDQIPDDSVHAQYAFFSGIPDCWRDSIFRRFYFGFVKTGGNKSYIKMSEFKVTEKQLTDAHNTFNLFDKKGVGCVNSNELGNVFKSLALHVEDEKLKRWADEADEEATGKIEWEQFKELFQRKLREDEDERELREAFRVLDKNNKGVIDVADLRWILKSLGDDLTEEEIDDMIAETDTDGSGTVDYEEFKSLMSSE